MGEQAEPASGGTTRPNVIVVMTDQQKASSLGMYGNPDVRTPALDELADSGVRFDQAYTVHPLCVPSRSSMWTGTYPHNHGVRTNELRLDHDRESHLSAFVRAGYRTGLIGKNHCFDERICSELDTFSEYMHQGVVGDATDPRDEAFHAWINQPGLYTDLFDSAATPLPADHCPAARIAEQAVDFIDADDDRPFLLWVSFPEPHERYYAPEPFHSMYDPSTIELPSVPHGDPLEGKPERQRLYRDLANLSDVTEDTLRRAVATYYAAVSFVDAQVRRIIDALEATGQRDDTVVVYLADHGDFAGEHGMVVKCNAFYDCLTRIPLIMSCPGHIPAGRSSVELVSIIDVMPTVAVLAGLPSPAGSRGVALPDLNIPTEPRSEVFAEYGAGGAPVTADRLRVAGFTDRSSRRDYLRAREAEGRAKMVRTHDWKYVVDPTTPDAEELYDLRSDPGELHNLSRSPDHTAIITALRDRILAWSLETEDASPVPRFFDPVTLINTPRPH